MFPKSSFLVPALVFIPFHLHAADPAAEYEQVKAIALRDAKVRAAYEQADRRLAEKIVEIDPALKGYSPGRSAVKPSAKPTAAQSTAATAPKPKAPKAPSHRDANAYQRSHVVAKGETLGTIAAKYHVTVAELRQANEINNEKKLPVGQVLAIPNGSGKPQPAKKGAKAADKSWWDQVKGSM